jgi:hypothetical protein
MSKDKNQIAAETQSAVNHDRFKHTTAAPRNRVVPEKTEIKSPAPAAPTETKH